MAAGSPARLVRLRTAAIGTASTVAMRTSLAGTADLRGYPSLLGEHSGCGGDGVLLQPLVGALPGDGPFLGTGRHPRGGLHVADDAIFGSRARHRDRQVHQAVDAVFADAVAVEQQLAVQRLPLDAAVVGRALGPLRGLPYVVRARHALAVLVGD